MVTGRPSVGNGNKARRRDRRANQSATTRVRPRNRAAANGSLTGSNSPTSAHSDYAAVSVVPGEHACSAARQMGNLRFLNAAAPRLPLGGCDLAVCQCSFAHHADRRRSDDSERRMSVGLASELYGQNGKPERRRFHGRRVTDRS